MDNFQSWASEQGQAFSDSCLLALKYAGIEVIKDRYRVVDVDIEIDILARNKHGLILPFECKGSMRRRPGLERTDTCKKAIFNAFMYQKSAEYSSGLPLLLFVSHLPKYNSSGWTWLSRTDRDQVFDVLHPWNNKNRLEWLANADAEEIEIDQGTPLETLLLHQWGICGNGVSNFAVA